MLTLACALFGRSGRAVGRTAGPNTANAKYHHWLQNRSTRESREKIGAVAEWGQSLGAQLISRFLTLLFALVILFCLYRDGDSVIEQTSTVIDKLFGRAVQQLAMNMVATVRETNGSLLIALVEGIAFGMVMPFAGYLTQYCLGP